MLTIKVEPKELLNERDFSITPINGAELHLEHSLISLSKWESKWKKPYLTVSEDETHTKEEILDYIYCMSIDKNVDKNIINYLDFGTVKKILDYIADPHTATQIFDLRPNQPHRQERMTSELIYYYMIYFGIPWEAQKWHLNRLMMLIKVCGIKGGTTNQQMSMADILTQNRRLNAMRRPR